MPGKVFAVVVAAAVENRLSVNSGSGSIGDI